MLYRVLEHTGVYAIKLYVHYAPTITTQVALHDEHGEDRHDQSEAITMCYDTMKTAAISQCSDTKGPPTQPSLLSNCAWRRASKEKGIRSVRPLGNLHMNSLVLAINV